MAIFAVEYLYTDDAAGRDTHRAEHREFLGAQTNVLLSGPTTNPDGALIVLAADSTEAVEQLLDADPFKREGLIAQRTVRGYNPVIGALSQAAAELS